MDGGVRLMWICGPSGAARPMDRCAATVNQSFETPTVVGMMLPLVERGEDFDVTIDEMAGDRGCGRALM